MSCANYKQYDSRWGSRNYNGSSTMAMAGCGPTSVANIVHAVNSKITPIDTMKYMQQHDYAVYGHGTAWAGIPACMKHFGMKDVKNISSMSDVWKYLKRGYFAIFLMSAGSRGGITWTTSGHYIAVTAYKYKNKKHYVWTRDSGGRNHTGWHCYETQMRGLISQVWVGITPKRLEKLDRSEKKPAEKKPAVKKPAAKKPKPKTNAKKISEQAVSMAWPYKTPSSKYKGKPMPAYKKALDKVFPHRSGWSTMPRTGRSCDVFAATTLRASGVDKHFPRGLSEQFGHLKKHKTLYKATGVHKSKDMQDGDIIIYKTKKGGHICFCCVIDGKKYRVDAGRGGKRYGMVTKPMQNYDPKKYKFFKVYRPKG